MDSRQTETTFNQARYPVLDRNGKPFTPNCRVRFRAPYYYINTADGTGRVIQIDSYGGVLVEADAPWPSRDSRGAVTDPKNHRVRCETRYQYSGLFRNCTLAQTYVGDPFEHGRTECFVEIEE